MSITVSQLIAALQTYDPDLPVVLMTDNDEYATYDTTLVKTLGVGYVEDDDYSRDIHPQERAGSVQSLVICGDDVVCAYYDHRAKTLSTVGRIDFS